MSSDASQARMLRSSRGRKCKSIDDIGNKLLKLKDPRPVSHTWPRSGYPNVTTLSLSGSSFSIVSSQGPLEQHLQGKFDEYTPLRYPFTSFSSYHRSDHTGDSEYLTAPSHFEESRSVHESSLADIPILRAVDKSSGAVFERIHQGHQGEISAHIAATLLGSSSQLAVHPVSTSHQPLGDECTTQPVLVLTMPTPLVPHSPLFIPQSPITVSKFFSAVALATPNPTGTDAQTTSHFDPSSSSSSNSGSGSLSGSFSRLGPDPSYLSPPPNTLQVPPPLLSCGTCTLPEFEQDAQCRICNERWLACKIWYRANDGGRRRWLTEPYVRPGECNSVNRAMMMRGRGHGLGYYDGFGDAVFSLGDDDYRACLDLKTKKLSGARTKRRFSLRVGGKIRLGALLVRRVVSVGGRLRRFFRGRTARSDT
ncbi:hypothetical protein BDY19DRAFT_911397 [Irpex rosettiformis]|uniref:Uncharacterized protein n=1 Tax=Irpex rosettiformis TaxID=378272 RepID=A0ACB8UIL8_9APHY|nr:hypothetical protein BDY19DRAFT_911397 [Irpex rosettiformis]